VETVRGIIEHAGEQWAVETVEADASQDAVDSSVYLLQHVQDPDLRQRLRTVLVERADYSWFRSALRNGDEFTNSEKLEFIDRMSVYDAIQCCAGMPEFVEEELCAVKNRIVTASNSYEAYVALRDLDNLLPTQRALLRQRLLKMAGPFFLFKALKEVKDFTAEEQKFARGRLMSSADAGLACAMLETQQLFADDELALLAQRAQPMIDDTSQP
jgi:hypothetical protein